MPKHQFMTEDPPKNTRVVQARVPPEIYDFVVGYSKAFHVTKSTAVCSMLDAALSMVSEEDMRAISSGKRPSKREKANQTEPAPKKAPQELPKPKESKKEAQPPSKKEITPSQASAIINKVKPPSRTRRVV